MIREIQELGLHYGLEEYSWGSVAVIHSLGKPLESAGDLLDVMGNIRADGYMLREGMMSADFYELKTGLAGEMLQKASNYRVRIALVGDFVSRGGSSLKDFMGECYRTGQIIFAGNPDEVRARWSGE